MISTLLTLGLAGATFQPQEPATPVFLPLQHLVLPTAAVTPPPWGTLLWQNNHAYALDMLGLEDPALATTQVDQALSFLAAASSDAVDAGRLTLQVAGTSLLLGGDAAEIERVLTTFRHASQTIGQSVQIEVAVWDAVDRETPDTVLDAGEFQQFLGNRQPLWRCVATTRVAQAVGLQQMRRTRYVRDIAVEIASGKTMCAPLTDQYGEGINAVVRAVPLVGNQDFVLHMQFALAQRRGVVRTVATGQTNAPDIELPTLETAFGAFCGRLPDGGALCATLRGHASSGGQHIVTVRARRQASPGQARVSGCLFLPIAALTAEGLTRRVQPADDFVNQDTESDNVPGSGGVSLDSLLDLVRAGLGAGAERVTLEPVAGFLIARGPEADLRTVTTIVQALQDRVLRPITVRHTGTVRLTEEDTARQAPILHELTLPSLAGRELTVVRCLEMPVLSDVHIEVAQEAGILDPMVSLLQSGCFLRNRMSPYDDAMHAQTVVVNLHALPPPARSVLPGGVLMAEEASQVRATHDGIVANEQLVEHGDGPAVTIDGRSCRSVLTTLVRW